MSHHTSYTLAGICTVGGVFGYAKTRSLPSLIAGVSVGGLYALTGYLIQNNKDSGFALGTGTSAVLSGAMIPRAIKTKKAIPLTLSAVALLGLGYHGKKLYEEINGI